MRWRARPRVARSRAGSGQEGCSIAAGKWPRIPRHVVIGDECLEHLQEIPRAKGLITPELGLSEDAVFECRLAIAEAVSNAFAHGQRDGVPYCRVHVQREPRLLRITVEDRGPGFRWAGLPARMPSPDEDHGRGVHLIRILMDGVSIVSTPAGTRIEMVKRLHMEEEAPQ